MFSLHQLVRGMLSVTVHETSQESRQLGLMFRVRLPAPLYSLLIAVFVSWARHF